MATTNSGSNFPPGQGNIPIEFTRATGPYFPGGSTTTATATGVSSAIQSINGDSSAAINLVAGVSSGATVNITDNGSGTIAIGVSVVGGSAVAGVGTAYPTSPPTGLMFYRTDLAGLYLWTGSAWVAV